MPRAIDFLNEIGVAFLTAMGSATVLHVGDDICHRIMVMEAAGFTVLHSECSIASVKTILGNGRAFEAITFHSEKGSILKPVVETTIFLTAAPLILFENPTNICDGGLFDLVVPPYTSPEIWIASLKETIESSRRICEMSRRLREDTEAVRSQSRALRSLAGRTRICPIDSASLWKAQNSGEDHSQNSNTNPKDGRKKL